MPARARIHGADKHEVGGVGDLVVGACDDNLSRFHGLAKCLKGVAVIFWKLV